ncbi:hypothetical protein SARC_10526 [Sphaeroforma arctica JP610]|uniref:Uncharacterized protein n=1 Tax=Sphaeroforma arctica JP610 TaxID=667725 RepID=A0A0L0FJP3_9EUKA|nr:hypothetical protein SARC_10526 [Sphaeroforma arctica JP610]KNC76999.1 hypothetical protein SARC_10526 [Sphaeroforma arctica JP610]|eukprot:XP_014150901.1 hypothetical protein SARC_10526 [Sphaeroforma arctica JP610]
MSTANPTGTPSPQGSRVSLADGAAEDIRSRMGKRPRKSTNESLTGSQDDTISLNEFRSPFWWIETIPFPKHDLKPLSGVTRMREGVDYIM